MTGLDAQTRARLREVLRRRYPWLAEVEVGPQAVEAGECDRCGAEARMVATCGPVRWAYLGRRCALDPDAAPWCDGHAEDAVTWRRWLAALPDDADAVARLWWVATGEVRLDPAGMAAMDRVLQAGDRAYVRGGAARGEREGA